MPAADPHPAPAEPDLSPIPARCWWLKRLGILSAACLVVLVGLRVWWGWEAQRRLAGLVEKYHALGQPILREDFVAPPLPDAENAAYYLMLAADALIERDSDGIQLTAGDICDNPEYPDEARELVDENRPALELARLARACPRASWKLRFDPLAIDTFPEHIEPLAKLAAQLAATAIFEHFEADDAASLETLQDLLVLADRLHAPIITCPSEHWRWEGRRSTGSIEFLAFQLLVDEKLQASLDGNPSRHRTGVGSDLNPATRKQIQRLMDLLLEEESFVDGWRQALIMERCWKLDSTEYLIAGGGLSSWLPAPPIPWPLRFAAAPAWRLHCARLLEGCTSIAEAGAAGSFPAGRDLAAGRPEWSDWTSGVAALTTMGSLLWQVPYDHWLKLYFRSIAQRRMAATALAIRLFEVDHCTRPATLDELVPRYLPSVPLDPFSAVGEPLRYRPNDDPPLLYSIGADGVDSGGRFTVDSDLPDLVFFLNGDRPRRVAEFPERFRVKLEQQAECRRASTQPRDCRE